MAINMIDRQSKRNAFTREFVITPIDNAHNPSGRTVPEVRQR
jgi:hypothetical protein